MPRAWRVVVASVLAGFAATAGAEVVTPEAVAEATLNDWLAPVVAARAASVKIVVAPSDARRNLAPCQRAVGVVPPGARPVGRTVVGVRCVDGATWQTFLSADVQVEADVWQTTRALRAGESLAATDVARTRAPLTAADFDPRSRGLNTVDGRQASPVGRLLQRSVANGRALATADLKDAGRVNPGDPVVVVYQGAGFAVSAEGRAVGAADPGANLLIRLASGSVVQGTLRDDHRVEMVQ